MSRVADIETFLDQSRRAATMRELHAMLQGITREMRFDHFGLVRNLPPPVGRDAIKDEFIVVGDFPSSWVEHYVDRSLMDHDPIVAASRQTNVAFTWSTVPKLITLTRSQQEVTELSRKAGFVEGFTVPFNGPGALSGACHFGVRMGHDLPSKNLTMAKFVGALAFTAAGQLASPAAATPGRRPKITERQLECIALVAQGKTDWEIAQILGISETTVKWHLNEAKRLYDTPKRVQLVLRAAFEGLLPLATLAR